MSTKPVVKPTTVPKAKATTAKPAPVKAKVTAIPKVAAPVSKPKPEPVIKSPLLKTTPAPKNRMLTVFAAKLSALFGK